MSEGGTRFTAAEGGARLAAAARRRNTIAVELAAFVSTRLVLEQAHAVRGRLSAGAQRSVCVSRASRVRCAAYELRMLTDLAVCEAKEYGDIESWTEGLETNEVVVCTSAVLRQLLVERLLTMAQLNVLVIDSCHLVHTDEDLQTIMQFYKASIQQPRVLSLTYPLFTNKRPGADGPDPEEEPSGDGTPSEDNTTESTEPVPTSPTPGVPEAVAVEEFGASPNVDDFEMYSKLEWRVEELETSLCCQMDLAEDIDGGKRFSATVCKPKELIVSYSLRRPASAECQRLEAYMRAVVQDVLDFLDEHRYDPTEIYGEDLYEEFMNIPNPTIEPKLIFRQFIYILDELGPYGADKAAFSLLARLEKLKIKVPYERHFLLLCLCTTVFVKIRCYADLIFSKYSDLDRIKLFSTAKVLRFIEILEQFESVEGKSNENDDDKMIVDDNKNNDAIESSDTPMNGVVETTNSEVLENDNMTEVINADSCYSVGNDKTDDPYTKVNGNHSDINDIVINHEESKLNVTNKMLNDIEKCDFITLSNKIEDKVNTIEANLKEIHEMNIASVCLKEKINESESNKVDNDAKIPENDVTSSKSDPKTQEFDLMDPRSVLGFTRRPHRVRGRGRVQRNVVRSQQTQLNPDALCGIVFMNEPIMAKIMFLLVVDLSRSSPRLAHVSAQYCAAPDTGARDPAELRRRCRAREDALKRFRMHDCNLLLATSALEEGIDLPRCNLVLRWDLPPSYRSHGLCRGRARAPRSACLLLCPADERSTSALLRNVAGYRELDQIISRKCGCGIQDEPPQEEEDHADSLTTLIQPYTPAANLCDKNEEDSIHDSKDIEDDGGSSCDINERIDYDKEKNRIATPVSVCLKDEATALGDEEKNHAEHVDRVREIVDERDAGTGSDAADKESEAKDHDDSNNTEVKEEGEINRSRNSLNVDLDKEFESEVSGVCSEYKNDLFEKLGSKSNQDNNVNLTNSMCMRTDDSDHVNKVTQKVSECNDQIDELNIEVNKLVLGNDKTHSKLDVIGDINKFHEEISNTEDAKEIKLNQGISDKIAGEVSKTNDDILDNELNLVCNKCNKKRTSVETECCVDSADKIDRNDLSAKKDDIASVDLGSAIALINRYCGKLPSDTFTRLAPSWRLEQVRVPGAGGAWVPAWVCSLRLPLNCPVKCNIVGHPMATRALARRVAALQACRVLHRAGELDDQLMPIGKENFKAAELEGTAGSAADARPGTTKRRQYYYKRTARAFTDCEPVVDTTDEQLQAELDGKAEKTTSRNVLYAISCSLCCALPERYNTRGRRLHAPQHAGQAVAVLVRGPHRLQIPSFPVYTRSGEVRVQVLPSAASDTRLSPRRAELVRRFMRFVFAEVLRVRRRGMTLQAEGSTHNNYYVVPTLRVNNPDGSNRVDIDWKFLEEIYQYTEDKLNSVVEKPMVWRREEDDDKADGSTEKRKVKKMDNPLLKPGETFVFDAEKYREAVVTPWYRNQDQPQFFLVAEICWNLTPDSAFPSATHTSFRDYYSSKYGVTLTQPSQPLLDVDHTSARLNLLTPRYVNRKGVALPVSSERTRRAKRDRLDQKQILVPELCTVHPFAAPLWFATVALPCVLYRINALLIADEIRRAVAIEVGLGVPTIDESTCPGFQWPPLDFGWSLAEVLNADSEKNEKKKENDPEIKEEETESQVEEQKQQDGTEAKEKTINDILQEKEDAENGFEIGTWDNDMASSIPQPEEYDELNDPLPANLTFCTSASGGANWCDPVQKPKNQFNPTRTFSMADSDCSYMSSDFDTDDSDLNSEGSDETETSGFCSSKSNAAMGVRIEYKTAHEAEAVDLERQKTHPAPQPDDADDARDRALHAQLMRAGDVPGEYLEKFQKSVAEHEREIIDKGLLIQEDQPITDLLPESNKESKKNEPIPSDQIQTKLDDLFPYKNEFLHIENGSVTLESIEKNKRHLMAEFKKTLSEEEIKKLTCFSMIDVDIDAPDYKNEKVSNIGFDTKENYLDKVKSVGAREFKPYYEDTKGQGQGKGFDFDYQPDLEGHPGPSPSVILQALTMSNANDGINLERLETIGDSFLKFAITAYLYCAHPTVHEGKLSHMRSKQVSNLNLYRLGLRKRLGARMIASKFEPHDNWLPPAHRAPPAAHQPVDSEEAYNSTEPPPVSSGCFIPYNLITQHSIPDKSIADCVEALIGAYLLECGPRGALLFMAWLGIRVLPRHDIVVTDPEVTRRLDEDKLKKAGRKPTRRVRHDSESSDDGDDTLTRPVGSLAPHQDDEGRWVLPMFGELKAPPSPLLRYIADPEGELEQMLSGYDALERTLQYRFNDRSLLLQALTHASHQRNRLTDCYQRLEFLGDAILDYLITRHLYEDPRRHSPGALTDLRSALVNNTIFATLAARHGLHKYFRHMSPGLNEVLTRYVKIQEENGHSISEEHYLIHEDEMEQAEDVEVPKALGDLFESVAGAIFLDSGMSLAAVWSSYELLMGAELEAFSAAAPKSPVRELLEAEPDTAKFGKPERLADGRRVRVCVEVFGRGAFKGVGRNYRIAKGTAARCALRHLKRHKQH